MTKKIITIFTICSLMFLFGILYDFLGFAQALTPITSVVLNSTSGTNTTKENLTAYPLPYDSGQRYIYNWYLNGKPVTELNIPFDAFSGLDYVNYNNVTSFGSYPVYTNYSSTGGFGNKGYFPIFYDVAESMGGYINYNLAPLNLTENFSISFWLKKNNYFQFGGDKNFFGDNQVYPDFEFTVSNSWVMSFKLRNNSDSVVSVTANVPDTLWHNYIGIFEKDSSNGLKIYRDGVLINNVSTIGYSYAKKSPAAYYSTDGFGIATLSDPLGFDELLIFKKSLTDNQVKQIYNNYISPSYKSIYIDSSMINPQDTWSVKITPNDNTNIGSTVWSNNLTIQDLSYCPTTPQNWIINLSTNPIINSPCDLRGYNVTLTGTGNLSVNSTFYMKLLKGFSSGRRILMKPNGKIRMKIS